MPLKPTLKSNYNFDNIKFSHIIREYPSNEKYKA
jgi:hypothetical protein